MQHAVMAVPGIPCAECGYIWQKKGWIAVWEISKVDKKVLATAGEIEICPVCGKKQKLPKVFDKQQVDEEVANYPRGQSTGYFCILDCSRGAIESWDG